MSKSSNTESGKRTLTASKRRKGGKAAKSVNLEKLPIVGFLQFYSAGLLIDVTEKDIRNETLFKLFPSLKLRQFFTDNTSHFSHSFYYPHSLSRSIFHMGYVFRPKYECGKCLTFNL